MNKPTQKFKGPAGHRKRLRERFLNTGSSAIADYELHVGDTDSAKAAISRAIKTIKEIMG